MLPTRILAVVAALALTACATTFAQQGDTTIIGTWQGALDLQSIQLRLVFHIRDSAGVYVTTVDSPDQRAKGLPTGSTEWRRDSLKIAMPQLGASYTGALNARRDTIVGTFLQLGKTYPLCLVKNDVVDEPKRPQEPKPPYPYRTEEVSYKGLSEGVALAGTLTIPKGKGPWPAVLLITGSGPQDRNEELLGHKPFLVIADYLTRQGIEVLRVDDRGVGASKGDFVNATSADFAKDALAGVQFLKKRREVNKARIGLIGHSEGGMIAPMVAADSKDVGFIVLMAGPGVNGADLITEQSAALTKAEGLPDSIVAKNRAITSTLTAIVRTDLPDSVARVRMAQAYSDWLNTLSPAEKKILDVDESPQNTQLERMLTPWFRYFMRYDPAPTLSRLHIPVLALNGEKDMQVPVRQNLPAIDSALKAGGNTRYKTMSFPGLNHLFQSCKTGSVGEYMRIETTIEPEVLETMAIWITGLK